MNTHIHPLFQAILAPITPPYEPPKHDPRWLDVTDAFNEPHTACESCEHKLVTRDAGSEDGKFGERFYSDCTLGQERSHHPGMCPAIQPTQESEVQP